jgi:D-glycero-alpha-D-manno-heptose-7-phosphate kinase
VCGAGGGGCLIVFTAPERREDVARALESGGATVLPFAVAREGLTIEKS